MDKQWLLYILECRDGTLYTGITDDLSRRITAHSSGKGAKYTRGRGPVELVYYEEHEEKTYAMRREWEIKQLSRSEKEAMMQKQKAEIVDFIEKKMEK